MTTAAASTSSRTAKAKTASPSRSPTTPIVRDSCIFPRPALCRYPSPPAQPSFQRGSLRRHALGGAWGRAPYLLRTGSAPYLPSTRHHPLRPLPARHFPLTRTHTTHAQSSPSITSPSIIWRANPARLPSSPRSKILTPGQRHACSRRRVCWLCQPVQRPRHGQRHHRAGCLHR